LNEECVALFKQLLPHHSIIFVLIYDDFEACMPNVGQLQASDGSKQCSIDTSSSALRQQHQHHFASRRAQLQDLARLPGFVLLECATHDDPLSVLQASLGRR